MVCYFLYSSSYMVELGFKPSNRMKNNDMVSAIHRRVSGLYFEIFVIAY